LASEHEVDLLALAEQGEGTAYVPAFEKFCRTVRVVTFQHPAWEKLFPSRLLNPLPSTIAHWSIPAVTEAIDEMFAAGGYDAVHILDLVLAQYFLDDHVDIPLIVDRTRVDLQYQLMEHKRVTSTLKNRLLNYENYSKLWSFEKKVARRCAMQVLCGPDDESFVRQYISRSVPIAVIANGVDLDYFHPSAAEAPRDAVPTVIFCGAMDYMPNVDALRWYFSEIHDSLAREVPQLKVLIVGKDPIAEVSAYGKKDGVTVTGGVPDVRPYYKRAWLQMVPLRIGGGTRLKIVESLGIGTPVVSTRIGAQGLDLAHEHDVLYADTATDFVRETARALRDRTLRDRLAENGAESARSRLSWAKLGGDLLEAYASNVGRKTEGAAVCVS
jgi:glycosyltransferase involved in cell wall biosynthesis